MQPKLGEWFRLKSNRCIPDAYWFLSDNLQELIFCCYETRSKITGYDKLGESIGALAFLDNRFINTANILNTFDIELITDLTEIALYTMMAMPVLFDRLHMGVDSSVVEHTV